MLTSGEKAATKKFFANMITVIRLHLTSYVGLLDFIIRLTLETGNIKFRKLVSTIYFLFIYVRLISISRISSVISGLYFSCNARLAPCR
jgi:hypothetical protein